jgi:hypothetical protein
MQQLDTYLVSKKGIYSTRDLIENTERHLPEWVVNAMPPPAVFDVRECGRALAFDLSTAAAFHILRAIESCILEYLTALKAKPRASQRNWGAYLALITNAGGDPNVVAALSQIKNLHRNPTMHPQTQISSDEALGLLGIAQSAIVALVRATSQAGAHAPIPSGPQFVPPKALATPPSPGQHEGLTIEPSPPDEGSAVEGLAS